MLPVLLAGLYITGLSLVLEKLLQYFFSISAKFSKVKVILFIFSLKKSLKIVFSSITSFKKYSKTNLSMFFYNKKLR